MNHLNKIFGSGRSSWTEVGIPMPTKIILLFLIVAFSNYFVNAQGMDKVPGKMIICPAKFEDMHTRVNIPESSAQARMNMLQNSATAEFEITFGPGAQANEEARTAFQYALDIWATQIVSDVPIKIFAEFANLGPGVLASAGPAYNVRNFPNAPELDVLYPAALANSIAGEVLFPDEEYDLIVNLGNGIPWYFGLDGNTPAGQFDFVTVALHEAGHGLGFTTVRGFNNGVGTLRSNGFPSVFGLFIEDGEGNLLLDFPDPSVEIGDAFTGGDLFMGGTFAIGALNGNRPELYAPSNFQGGSSIAHWDEGAFPAGDVNSLMTPQVGSAESNFDIGDITRGLFRDMGWQINMGGQVPISVDSSEINLQLFVDSTVVVPVAIQNISDTLLNISISTAGSSPVIASILPDALLLEADSNASFTINFDATNVGAGFYSDTLFIETAEIESFTALPVNVQVLDGTESPEITVNPDSFAIALEKGNIRTETLSINNNGTAVLQWDASVLEDSATASFTGRVYETSTLINTIGFESQLRFNESSSLSSSFQIASGQLNNLVSTIYATDFEDFDLGDINGTGGWLSQFEGNWIISDENPKDGTNHFRGISDGLGSERPATPLALTPTLTPGNEPFMSMSAEVNIQGEANTWEIIPQSPTAGSVVTRIQFTPDGLINILEPAGFVSTGVTTPTGYFTVKLIVDKQSLDYEVFIDGLNIYSGTAFSGVIEQVVFLSPMEVAGGTIDVDNLEIIDGNPDAFYLSVNPASGTVGIGETAQIDVLFDARSIEAGFYESTIQLSSNDPENAIINVPVELTVLSPPSISVEPDSIELAVDVTVDDPAVKTQVITLSNSGQSPLEFETALGPLNFTSDVNSNSIASLNMETYGVSFKGEIEERSAQSLPNFISLTRTKTGGNALENSNFSDSIFYDSGINFPDDFSGVQTSAYTSAIRFETTVDFTLTAVRNAYRTESSTEPYILEIYRGGSTPNEGELLQTKVFNQLSEEGLFAIETLDEAINFNAGERFWVVHKYADDIAFPQGVDATATQRADTYYFSGDGGASYSPSGFVFLVRALSGNSDSYLTLSPASGSVPAGGSVEVIAEFDGSVLANGLYEREIVVSSNDPVNSVSFIPTSFSVSGQTAEISLSREFILFNDVFLGSSRTRTFTLSNVGLADLEISSITSDNQDFQLNFSSVTLGAGDSINIDVTFSPTMVGSINGIVSIESSDSENSTLQVVVNGVGVDPPIAEFAPRAITENVDAGEQLVSTISLNNPGNSPLIYSFPDLAVMAMRSNPDIEIMSSKAIEGKTVKSIAKGEFDNRVGAEINHSVGSDGGYGYTWIDSDEPNGPIYTFTDISSTGNEITLPLGDDGFVSVDLPFLFGFYGEQYNFININANGWITFDENPSGSTFSNPPIPSTNDFNNFIAVLWHDLTPDSFDGAVHYQQVGNNFIVQWTNVSEFSGADDDQVTFQVVLASDGTIDMYYDDVENASFKNQCTVGIQNEDGSSGAQVVFNSDYLKDNLAIRFVPPAVELTPFITNVSRMSGVVPAGGSVDLNVTLDATSLTDGTYFDELSLSSNAPIDTASTALFELIVTGFPEIALSTDSLSYEGIFVGLATEASLLIQNIGSKELSITSIETATDNFFADESGGFTIPPNGSRIVNVTFEPQTVGFLTDELVIESNDVFGNETINVFLTGEGIDPPIVNVNPDSLNAIVYDGETVTKDLILTNEGQSELIYSVSPTSFSIDNLNLLKNSTYEKIDYPKILSKESPDNRVGPAFLNASGGPGSFGYTWQDSGNLGVEYEFIDISNSGELLDVGQDGDTSVDLPFTFNFFGVDYTSVNVGANGLVSFSEFVGSNFVNQQIPSADNPNNFIAILWDDLEPADGDGVYVQAQDSLFIIQYENVPGFGFPPFLPIPEPVTFQLLLYPDGSFKMQYKEVESSTIATSSTVGIEGPSGLNGLQVVFNTEYLVNERAILFTPPVNGTLAPFESDTIPIDFISQGIERYDIFNGNIKVRSNDPINAELDVPVTVEYRPLPEVVGFSLINAELDEEIGNLENNDIINLDNYANNEFSVVADVLDEMQVASMLFTINNDTVFVDNSAPFSLAGENGNDYESVAFSKGIIEITATPFTQLDGEGIAGISESVTFEVIDNQPIFCYAESVVEYLPAQRKNGRDIPISRSNPQKALGEPQENDSYNFVSLGFGGSITLEMGCDILDHDGPDFLVVETTFRDTEQKCNNYPEKARVEASIDGENWVVVADEICRDGEVDLANGPIERAKYIRITDISNPDDFREGNAEAYDLDGIIVISNIQNENALALAYEKVNILNNVSNAETVDLVSYPNPASNFIKIDFEGNATDYKLTIINNQGGTVISSTINIDQGNSTEQIKISSLKQGLYYLRILDDQGAIVNQTKFIKY